MQSVPRPWVAVSRRRRAILALGVAVALAFVGWFTLVRDPWPARAVLGFGEDIWPLGFSPDSSTFATSSPGRITLWDTATGKARADWRLGDGHLRDKAAFSPDARTLVTRGFSRNPLSFSIKVFEVATGRLQRDISLASQMALDVAFTEDGRSIRTILAPVMGNNLTPGPWDVVTWDVETGQERSRRSFDHPKGLGAADLSPDGRMMVIFTRDPAQVMLWDLDSGNPPVLLRAPGTPTFGDMAFTFSADGTLLTIGRSDGAFEVWDTRGPTLKSTIRAHSTDVWPLHLDFSADGDLLASGGPIRRRATILEEIRQGTFKLVGSRPREECETIVVDLATGRLLARTGSGASPRISPDGRTLAIRVRDLTIRLRDLPETSGRQRPAPKESRP